MDAVLPLPLSLPRPSIHVSFLSSLTLCPSTRAPHPTAGGLSCLKPPSLRNQSGLSRTLPVDTARLDVGRGRKSVSIKHWLGQSSTISNSEPYLWVHTQCLVPEQLLGMNSIDCSLNKQNEKRPSMEQRHLESPWQLSTRWSQCTSVGWNWASLYAQPVNWNLLLSKTARGVSCCVHCNQFITGIFTAYVFWSNNLVFTVSRCFFYEIHVCAVSFCAWTTPRREQCFLFISFQPLGLTSNTAEWKWLRPHLFNLFNLLLVYNHLWIF